MGSIVVPRDFVVLDMAEDPYIPLILGRDALKTLGALIDCESETITIWMANEKVVFDFFKSSKELMVEVICSFEVVKGMADEKIEGCDVFVAPVFSEEFEDDKKKIKNVVAEN